MKNLVKVEEKRKLFVNTKDESPRMFESDFIDFFSRIHWSVPLFIFIPTICFFFYRSVAVLEVSILNTVLFALAGIFIWSITEYVIHRWVFHFHPKSAFMKKLHFMFHGVHHDFPQDSMRLVMPPAVSITLGFVFYGFFFWVFSFAGIIAFLAAYFAGFLIGYLFYDMMHYASHHSTSNNWYIKYIKDKHMKHHYKEPDLAFGFTTPLWDIIFGTTMKDD